MSAEAYPLQWPEGWPRTPTHQQDSDSRFSTTAMDYQSGYRKTLSLTMGRARDQLLAELERLGARDVVISSNVKLRLDGLPYANNTRIPDPGVAVYFTYKKRPMVMARDAYYSVAGNLRSLGLAIEAMRQLERHGGSYMMEKAFTGFAAIAPPDWKKPWREVFGVKPDWSGDITSLYREKARNRHPDAGGSDEMMAELNVAYSEAKEALGQ